MSEITVRDLSEIKELDAQTMSSTVGGFSMLRLAYPVWYPRRQNKVVNKLSADNNSGIQQNNNGSTDNSTDTIGDINGGGGTVVVF